MSIDDLSMIYQADTNRLATTENSLQHELNIKDHLGNSRLTFTDKNNNGQIDFTISSSTNEILQVTERSQRVKGV